MFLVVAYSRCVPRIYSSPISVQCSKPKLHTYIENVRYADSVSLISPEKEFPKCCVLVVLRWVGTLGKKRNDTRSR